MDSVRILSIVMDFLDCESDCKSTNRSQSSSNPDNPAVIQYNPRLWNVNTILRNPFQSQRNLVTHRRIVPNTLRSCWRPFSDYICGTRVLLPRPLCASANIVQKPGFEAKSNQESIVEISRSNDNLDDPPTHYQSWKILSDFANPKMMQWQQRN